MTIVQDFYDTNSTNIHHCHDTTNRVFQSRKSTNRDLRIFSSLVFTQQLQDIFTARPQMEGNFINDFVCFSRVWIL